MLALQASDQTGANVTFGERIRKLRLTQGISVVKTAAVVGCHAETLRNWEAGRTKPDLTRAGAIARALNVPVAALFTDELVVAEIVVSAETVARIRKDGREACGDVARRLAEQLEPAIWQVVTRPAADTRPGARAKPRRTRAERLAELNARSKSAAKRSIE